MAINPSCNLAGDLVSFPNLGDPPFPIERVDIAKAELISAGFPRNSITILSREREIYRDDSHTSVLMKSGIYIPSLARQEEKVWATFHRVTAKLYYWEFERYWYYWVASACEGHNPMYKILFQEAKTINDEFGKEIRVDGHAGGKEVTEDVGSYHVDTSNGLAVLVKAVKQNYLTRFGKCFGKDSNWNGVE